jgi:hypothetical protein
MHFAASDARRTYLRSIATGTRRRWSLRPTNEIVHGSDLLAVVAQLAVRVATNKRASPRFSRRLVQRCLLEDFLPLFQESKLFFAEILETLSILDGTGDEFGHVAGRMQSGNVDKIGALFIELDSRCNVVRRRDNLCFRTEASRLL